eukprot:TRINITY_DN7501_c3_g1_i1.p1 TRINITY_DN7501_c3_g1~~TRINITY_DN7501_c3_g1_i1.p1  ORF type:complete len:323 (+),score=32.62 TRINITY_DN7501_c3_g1_i1:125-970(+)
MADVGRTRAAGATNPSDTAPSCGSGSPAIELETCAGVGWIVFGGSSSVDGGVDQKVSNGLDQRMPMMRCIGARVTKNLVLGAKSLGGGEEIPVPASVGNSKDTVGRAANSRGVHTDKHVADANQVPQRTHAVACAGRLSMILSSSTPPAGNLQVAAHIAHGDARDRVLWNQCRWNCSGMSVRLNATSVDEIASPFGDLASIGGQGVADVTGRAFSIVSASADAAIEAGPQRFLMDVTRNSQTICLQAVKIAKRSVTQVGRLVLFPWRAAQGNDAPEPPTRR